jgi:hypothetical protein
MIGLGVPGRPIRFLVAEERAPEGVRDRMGPEPALLTELLTRLAPRRGRVDTDGTALGVGPTPSVAPVPARSPPAMLRLGASR